MRSAATSSRNGARQAGGGSEHDRVGADALGEDDEDVRLCALESGGSGAGVPQRHALTNAAAPLDPRPRGVRHAVDEARVGRARPGGTGCRPDRSRSRSPRAQKVRIGSSGTVPPSRGAARRTRTKRARAIAGAGEEHRGEQPRSAPGREPVADRAAEGDAEAHRVAPHVGVEDAVVEGLAPEAQVAKGRIQSAKIAAAAAARARRAPAHAARRRARAARPRTRR